MKVRLGCVLVGFLSLVLSVAAQTSGSSPASAQVPPPLVNFSGVLTDVNSTPLTGVVGVTFSLYQEQQGGSPLWLETQNVRPNSTGHYTVLLGSTTSQGLPTSIFASGEAHWLGVQVQGQEEQPRVLLVSAPYALKAGDAETIGGLPPSAFVLASPASPSGKSSGESPTISATTNVGGSGTTDYIPLWTSGFILGDSALFQSGSGNTATVGINTTTPAATLDVNGGVISRGALQLPSIGTATAGSGFNSQPFSLQGSAYNSGTGKVIGPVFQWQAEPSANNTSNPAGTLNLLYGNGSGAPSETGLNIASNGQITFATGQAFPGTGNGTVTSVGSGAGLTGGPITKSGTLSVATGGVTNAMLQNSSLTVTASSPLSGGGAVSLGGSTSLGLKSCSANQILEFVSGAWACANPGTGTVTSVGTGLGLKGGPITTSGTLTIDTTVVPQLAAANTFNADQTINGNLFATGAVSASSFLTGGSVLAFGSYRSENSFFGFSGNTTMTGASNTASGVLALQDNTTGFNNTASGAFALETNTTGYYNTAVGINAGYAADNGYVTGSNNTLVGSNAWLSTGAITNATAIGANAEVFESNALVLGSIAGVNHAAFNTFVGIGTPAPLAALDVAGYQLETYIGNPGCGAHPFAGIAFGTAGFQNCGNYSMVGDSVNTYIAAPTGDIYFRTQNNTVSAMTIDQYGDVNIAGNLSKGGGSFKIDHPLDPANKYRYHSFVESPDMMNVYNGNIITNKRGLATVVLPDYFEALNRDFRYQLTVIGRFAQAIVAREISGNRFTIRTSKPGVKVSWQVTGVRHDAYADAHRIRVEVEKPPQEQGRYLHPELFGAPAEQVVGYPVPPAPAKPGAQAENAHVSSLKAPPASLK